MRDMRGMCIAVLALVLIAVLYRNVTLRSCQLATALSVQLDYADNAVFDSMMACKPNCELDTYERVWQARGALYRAWREEAQRCLD